MPLPRRGLPGERRGEGAVVGAGLFERATGRGGGEVLAGRGVGGLGGVEALLRRGEVVVGAPAPAGQPVEAVRDAQAREQAVLVGHPLGGLARGGERGRGAVALGPGQLDGLRRRLALRPPRTSYAAAAPGVRCSAPGRAASDAARSAWSRRACSSGPRSGAAARASRAAVSAASAVADLLAAAARPGPPPRAAGSPARPARGATRARRAGSVPLVAPRRPPRRPRRSPPRRPARAAADATRPDSAASAATRSPAAATASSVASS